MKSLSRRDTLWVESKATANACDNSTVGDQQLSYAWSMHITGSGQAVPVASVSKDPSVLVLDPHSLQSSTTYTLILTVTSAASSTGEAKAAASVVVVVGLGNVVAVIAGGTSRSVPALKSFILDGSASYDEDKPAESNQGLAYHWSACSSCVLTAPLQSSQRSTVTLYAPSNSSGSNNDFTLIVSSNGRSDATTVSISVLPFSAPSVSITSGVPNVNANDKLVLVANISINTNTKFGDASWSVSNPSVNLSSVALTPTYFRVTGHVITNLVLGPGTLPAGSSLIFTIRCSSPDGSATAFASTVVTVNSIPSPGYFSVFPSKGGVELQTPFTFAASNWEDPQTPLSYQFGFIPPSSSLEMTLAPVSFSAFASSIMLSSGDVRLGHQLTCFVSVFDALGANNSLHVGVEVGATDLSKPGQSQKLISSILTSAEGNPAQTQQALSAIATALNKVNCSASPHCPSLHRAPCGAMSHTCGRCFPTFVGEEGDSNELCVPLKSLLNFMATTNASNSKCIRDSECGPWQHCDPSTALCVTPNKACANDCSGHGKCSFESVQCGLPVTSCLQGDPSCSALCSCQVGYFGASCSISGSQLGILQNQRGMLARSLEMLISKQNVNAQTVQSWSNNLASISSSPEEMSPTTCLLLLSAHQNITAAASAVGADAGIISRLTQAIDNVQSATALNNARFESSTMNSVTSRSLMTSSQSTVRTTTTAKIQSLTSLLSLGELIRRGLVEGEPDAVAIRSNYRMVNRVQQQPRGNIGSTVSMPLTEAEAITTKPSQVQLPPLSSSITILSIKVPTMFVSS